MKSRHDRVRVGVRAAVVLVFGLAGGASAQVTGTGTPNTIPLWTSSNTIGNSLITQSANGDRTINVNGSLGVNGSIFLPATTGFNTGVISIGGAPVLYTVGEENTFVGPYAGNFQTTGVFNNAMGVNALFHNTTGNVNNAMGYQAPSPTPPATATSP